MGSIGEISHLCRLCLVKEQVNIPIFEEQGDIRQIFLKICSCLPVKITKEDSLPKKICDGCSQKLDSFYQFWKESSNSEKQLLAWLNNSNFDVNTITNQAVLTNSNKSSDTLILKQEIVDINDSKNEGSSIDYLLQQQQLPYQQNFNRFSQQEANATVTSEVDLNDEPPPAKRKKRAAPTKKRAKSTSDSEEDDDLDAVEAKVEGGDSDDSDNENDNQDPDYIDDSSHLDDQPGPSGVTKNLEAPLDDEDCTIIESSLDETKYECGVCFQIFATKDEFLGHHMSQFGQLFTCCRCEESYKSCTELYQHYESHKNENVVVQDEEEVVEEIILGYQDDQEEVVTIPQQALNENNELLYILDDLQCVNEVVIEEDIINTEPQEKIKKPDMTIVNLEHGYVIPRSPDGELPQQANKGKLKSIIVRKDSLIPVKLQASTSKDYYSPKPRAAQPKRRHEVPDFSATNYIMLNPNDDVDMVHYKCLRCEQLFINKFIFFRHIEKGRCYINNCDVCSASFTKNSDFYNHYVAEHTDRAVCHFCFRTFMYEKNVKEHMLRHLDQFRHRCEECNKGFYTVREYRNHYKNRHMGIRHKCETCGRSFADEYYFKRHIGTHAKNLKLTIV